MTQNVSRLLLLLAVCMMLTGCFGHRCGRRAGLGGWGDCTGEPGYDRPFPLGAVTDAHWETQQTNAEAADFIIYDHEFAGNTAQLAPGAKRHLEQVALRLEHVPFPVVIEQSPHNARRQLDETRRQTIVEALARMGHPNVESRVVIADAFPEGYNATEAQDAYSSLIGDEFNGGAGRRFGGRGGSYR